MSGIIGVCAGEFARHSRFTDCLANLDRPGGWSVEFATGLNVAVNRRTIARLAIATGADWVWFVDDDMVFEDDHLERLLAHGLPVVASLYVNRKPPFYPVAYAEKREVNGQTAWVPVVLAYEPEEGLAEVAAAGTGGLLVKREVFEAIPYDTWFEHDLNTTEDLPFCERITAAGYKIHLDIGATMGHLSTYCIRPRRTDKGWLGELEIAKDVTLRVGLGS